MITVGITGQQGFIGSHVYNWLSTKKDIKLIFFKKEYFENPNLLDKFIEKCNFLIHLAAMNRHENPQVIYDTNISLVEKVIKSCESTSSTPTIIYSSSTQEEKNNLYGKSKIEGRKMFEKWAINNNSIIKSLIIPNVFGPFCKPHYNSFIATFCNQLINNETPTINNDSIVNLIYVNNLSEIIYNEIINSKKSQLIKVQHTTSQKVSTILSLLKKYHHKYIENREIPSFENNFQLQLFNTFTSYIPKKNYPIKFIQHSDERGSFVEIMRAGISGQTSFSTTKPNITRGNHYHTRKIERFAVIKGKAKIQLRKINSEETFNYILNGNEPSYIDMPIWYTHNITNIGDDDLITIFWINEAYNPEDPDTYFEKV